MKLWRKTEKEIYFPRFFGYDLELNLIFRFVGSIKRTQKQDKMCRVVSIPSEFLFAFLYITKS